MEEEPLDDLPFWRHPYKIAGLLMLVNTLLVIAEGVLIKSNGPIGTSPLPILFDLVIGGSLLNGSLRWRTWAIVRAVLGLLLMGGLAVSTGDFCTPVMMMCWVGGLVNLLVGRASGLRIAISLGAFAIYALAEVLGLALAAAGVI